MSLPLKTENSPLHDVRLADDEKLQSQMVRKKWSMGILNDPVSDDVPGTILLLIENQEGSNGSSQNAEQYEKKKTPDGKIVLDPQPEDCCNDPLNWKMWRKDAALLSVGLYCMVGGGMTPLLAAGFSDVAATFGVSVSQVSLTTGLFMLGLGLGSVVVSPTAILYGKRPTYLLSFIVFALASVWCAKSSSFTSLIFGRILQGISISPVECLPSATISEIYFLHERAYRIGIYSLLLLSGKNLVPIVSAVIIQNLSWRWVFWFTTVSGVLCGILLFFFVPETSWDRSDSIISSKASLFENDRSQFIPVDKNNSYQFDNESGIVGQPSTTSNMPSNYISRDEVELTEKEHRHDHLGLSSFRSTSIEKNPSSPIENLREQRTSQKSLIKKGQISAKNNSESDHLSNSEEIQKKGWRQASGYMERRRSPPNLSVVELLNPLNGRISNSSWLKVAIRPFVLFAYPAVLWSSIVYSCSIGWLIVISEGMTQLFRSEATYNFSALSAGLLYISPFIGAVLGTALAGKLSDLIVRTMAKQNSNIFEPEFRLVMAIPTVITTVMGLMGLGWSVQIGDRWIIPAVFFGIISFGCSLGAATAITYCVDSYKMYAGEALVTLNFSKNIFHGLIFSLFVTGWINDDGPKTVFIWLGVIQLIVMGFTIPMYIFGKRARMWTLRKNLMKNF
ncbi:putative MFS-type transporter [Erysiphe neolycopersici]|uniref:Putative MFS-type transporter n=1 Tax=Erysiphe neolycopersici TaxID=212602 RepID=A0A420HS86_9PEZI|nr:putative MFS-type transporter [Erysiphe neolycopersici]